MGFYNYASFLSICIKSFKDCLWSQLKNRSWLKVTVCVYQQSSFKNKLASWPLGMQVVLPLGSCFRRLCQLYTSLGLLILVFSGKAI